MKVIVRPSINKDVKSLPKDIKKEVERLTLKFIEAETLNEIIHIKKLKGYKNAYRVRIKDYRLGFFVENNTIVLSRILHRKELYRYFP